MEGKYIDKEHSYAVKGILIVLIVFAHNHFLLSSDDLIYNWFYSFHISSFFILPLFYESQKRLNWMNIRNIVIKNYVPYIIFTACCFCIYHFLVLKDNNLPLVEYLKGIFYGNPTYLKQNIGFIFLWFLAVYTCVSLIQLCYINCSLKGKFIWLIVGIGIFLFVGRNKYVCFYRECPFGISLALYYWGAGICAWLLKRYIKCIDVICFYLFIIVSVFYFERIWVDVIPYGRILIITGFFAVYEIAKFVKKYSIFTELGRYSLYIYIYHIFIYNICYLFFKDCYIFGWLIFIISFPICIGLGIFLQKIQILHSLIFPYNWQNFKSVFSK